MNPAELHPSILNALAALNFTALSPADQGAARPFAELGFALVSNPDNTGAASGANTTLALRKLAEARALIIENARMAHGADALLVVHQMQQALGLL